jgi:two-component system, NtrC family, nitrogen regulation response regulator GlnG
VAAIEDKDSGTVVPASTRLETIKSGAVGLTILYHPNPLRIGDISPLFDLGACGEVAVGRKTLMFRDAYGRKTASLETRFVSRDPFMIKGQAGGGVSIHTEKDTGVMVAGEKLSKSREVSSEELKEGVLIIVPKTVVLLLHYMEIGAGETEDFGLLGRSAAMRVIREDIRRVADQDTPVLLRGETGTGKELVADAIHSHSKRAERPYVVVNMAAIPPEMASAELFGHIKGAFTGATADIPGYFSQADTGTLFLDEVGDTHNSVQPMLLRATECGIIQPIRGKAISVNVRLIAATDSNLEASIKEGNFLSPLFHRLAGYEIRLPPLRERKEDIPRLFVHFLNQELEKIGEAEKLKEPTANNRPWLPYNFILQLYNYQWPGNVRELQNMARQIAIGNRGGETFRLPENTHRVLKIDSEEKRVDERVDEPSRVATTGPRPATVLTDEDIVEALRRNGFNFTTTALDLNVSRTWLTTRVDRCEGVRKAKDINAEEITGVLNAMGGSIVAAAAKLEVSERSLVLQMQRLGLNRK